MENSLVNRKQNAHFIFYHSPWIPGVFFLPACLPAFFCTTFLVSHLRSHLVALFLYTLSLSLLSLIFSIFHVLYFHIFISHRLSLSLSLPPLCIVCLEVSWAPNVKRKTLFLPPTFERGREWNTTRIFYVCMSVPNCSFDHFLSLSFIALSLPIFFSHTIL